MKIRSIVAGLVAALALVGCTKEIDKTADMSRKRPEWVVRGGGAFKDQSSTVFYGLGIANPMPNIALQRVAAQQRARADIASTLQTSVRGMVKDFMEHNADLFNPTGKATSQEIIQSVSSGVSDAQLSNCRILDYWEDDASGALYALAKLDLKDGFYGSYKENLAHALRENGMTKGMSDAEGDIKGIDKAIQDQRNREQGILNVTQTAEGYPSDMAAAESNAPAAAVAASADTAQPASPAAQAK